MDKSLLKIICCPKCLSELIIKDNILICSNCKKEYKIKEGIPILLTHYI